MRKSKSCNQLTWGLFNYRGIYFWHNIKDLRIYFQRIFYVLKHGYFPQATWETYCYFIDSMKKIYETVAEAKVSLAKAANKKFAEIAKYYIETQKM